jgi:hypothetical protein
MTFTRHPITESIFKVYFNLALGFSPQMLARLVDAQNYCGLGILPGKIVNPAK